MMLPWILTQTVFLAAAFVFLNRISDPCKIEFSARIKSIIIKARPGLEYGRRDNLYKLHTVLPVQKNIVQNFKSVEANESIKE